MTTIFGQTVSSDRARFAWLWDPTAPYPGPLPKPADATEAPETSAPGAAPEVTEPATPPAGGGQPEAALGAEHGSEDEVPVSGAVAAQVREGIAAAERGETVDLGSFAQYADEPDGSESEAPDAP